MCLVAHGDPAVRPIRRFVVTDLKPEGFEQPPFEPLEDLNFFELVRVNPESGTIVWPNGLDLDPSVLHGDFPPAGVSRFREISSTRAGT